MKYLFISLLLSVTFVSCAQEQQSAVTSRPNVLFIAVDDLRTQLGCYGDQAAKTPNIDELAAAGTVFDRAYCQQAVCNPSRASLMTGRRPNTTKVWDLGTHFREHLPDVITLPQYFRQHGYHTQSVGKIYHDPAWAQDSLSWSAPETLAITRTKGKYVLDTNLHRKGSWKAAATERAAVEDEAYIDGKVADAAVKLLSEIKGGPFFLAVGFRRPHLPFSAPARYWDLYNRDSLPLPDAARTPEGAPELALHKSGELRGYTDVRDKGPLSTKKIQELIHGYYAATSYVDAQIGKLLRELDRLGLRENTIVVLWSDHGFHLGEHELWGKTTNFELDTRVPLIISAPEQSLTAGQAAAPVQEDSSGDDVNGQAAAPVQDGSPGDDANGQNGRGAHSDALVELVDLYPTLAELAGLSLPSGLEGLSMVPLLSNPEQPWKKGAFSQFPRPWRYKKVPKIMGYSVRTDRYRYTEWQDFKTGEVEARELYDHRHDPLETTNLAERGMYNDDMSKLSELLAEGWKGALPHETAR